MYIVQVIFALWAMSFSPKCVGAFELQDTIHALIEENVQLHDQLENLTQALRELKKLLWNHSKGSGHQHDPEFQHLWNEWMETGMNADTHLLLEHVFCGNGLHARANLLRASPLLLTLVYLASLWF